MKVRELTKEEYNKIKPFIRETSYGLQNHSIFRTYEDAFNCKKPISLNGSSYKDSKSKKTTHIKDIVRFPDGRFALASKQFCINAGIAYGSVRSTKSEDSNLILENDPSEETILNIDYRLETKTESKVLDQKQQQKEDIKSTTAPDILTSPPNCVIHIETYKARVNPLFGLVIGGIIGLMMALILNGYFESNLIVLLNFVIIGATFGGGFCGLILRDRTDFTICNLAIFGSVILSGLILGTIFGNEYRGMFSGIIITTLMSKPVNALIGGPVFGVVLGVIFGLVGIVINAVFRIRTKWNYIVEGMLGGALIGIIFGTIIIKSIDRFIGDVIITIPLFFISIFAIQGYFVNNSLGLGTSLFRQEAINEQKSSGVVEEVSGKYGVDVIKSGTGPTIKHRLEITREFGNSKYIKILRGFEVSQKNDLHFGIRMENNSTFSIMDVQIVLDYPKTLFSIHDNIFQNIGNINPGDKRTAAYILTPLSCIHNEQINALITYKDHTGKKQTLHMRPKEVHCVCPFLKEKPMSEGEYSRLAASNEFVQEGISFKGISIEDLTKFIGETCRHILYKVKEYDIEGKKVIYLSGESLGEKAYYLLTAVIQEYKGLTQVVLRAHSDKKYGLNGFMNEMADSLRHLVGSVQNAKEIGIIENTQVINIIDFVVQRTNFNFGKKKEE